MNSSKILPLARLCARQVRNVASEATKVTEVPSANFSKLKESQLKFQKDDKVPIFLKAGAGDKTIYLASSALVTVGVVLGINVFFTLAVK